MFSETLLNGRTRDEDDVKKSLKIIEKESRRLSRLISNILDLTGKENLIFETSPEIVEVDREIRETIQGFNPMADLASNNINLDLESITARVDPAGLKQILTNILDNAIKYGPEGQEIDIRLRKEESSMVLSILDEGPGIPEEIHDKVWQSNWRKDNSEKHSESGSGIGLFVVKQYLQQMNGSVEIKNREGEGTKFAIRFPINLGE
jgi:two-component system phosphate regulon sensor histidine kinase PhoR